MLAHHIAHSIMSSDRTSFGIIDILRLGSGLLLFNAVASWFFTGLSTWGYQGKWLDSRYIHHRVLGRQLHFTLSELRQYDGLDPTLPIYIAINGSVYDVTASPSTYGPKGNYAFFSGRDSARAFVTGCFDKGDEFTHDLRGLEPQEVEDSIRGWQRFYGKHRKYWYVGTVEHEPLTGEPPSPCEHRRYPF